MLMTLPLSTTIVQTWSGTDLGQVGPIYPFVGAEVLLWIVGIAFWIGFHISQLRIEAQELKEDEQAAQSPERLNRVFAEEAE